MNWLREFNDGYATAVQAIVPLILGLASWLYYRVYRESKLQEGDAAGIVRPVFWTVGGRFRILAVHEFEASDDVSGYRHIAQNSRPDQWRQLIEIRTSMIGLRHEVVPKDDAAILSVIISRNGKEKWRRIRFNQ